MRKNGKNTLYGREKQVAGLLEKFGPFDKLLDLGCFDGKTSKTYGHFSNNVYGIEPELEPLKIAIRKFGKKYFKQGYAESIPFGNNYFDCIVFSDVLEHVSNEKKSLKEIFRVLKPEGKLIITTPHSGLFSFLDPLNYRYYFNKLLSLKTFKPYHRHYSLSKITSILNSAGFSKKNILLVKRSGFVITPIIYNLELLSTFFKLSFLRPLLLKGKKAFGELEWKIDFKNLGYYIAIVLEK